MATTETEEDPETEDQSAPSTMYVALVRLAFPTAALILAALYVENTYGRIDFGNLHYPYFVIALLVIFTLSVYVDEIRRLYNHSSGEQFTESIRNAVEEWQRSIGFVAASVGYLSLIDVIGFFVSSFFGMIAIMLIGGLRDPKLILGGTVGVLTVVYVLFVTIMGLNPPTGMGI